MRRWVLLVALLAGWLSSAPASAVSFGFYCLTQNLAGDCAVGEAQLVVDVTAGPGANQVSFTFTNSGPAASSITDVYFDDGSLLGIASVVNGTGVDFAQFASPPNLPGGEEADPDFDVTAGFLADSNPPAQPNGVNPNETVTIIFNLVGGGTLADVLDELADGSLRIGIHVQGFAGGGSESFINNDTELVPEPGTFALVGIGLVGLAAVRRRSA